METDGKEKSKSRAEEFLELYKKLEAIVANTYGSAIEGGSVAKLGRRAEFRHIRKELDYIRDVRNLLAHRPKIADEYMVEPSQAMIDLLESVIGKVECPAIAGNIMIKMDRVLSCSKGDFIMPVVRKMHERAISHIPVLNEGRVCGVFSNSTFIQCTISGQPQISENTMFYEIEEMLSFEKHQGEAFWFTEKTTPIDELSDLFDEASRNNQKIGMLFVTEHGRESEKLLGIITAWDVAGAY